MKMTRILVVLFTTLLCWGGSVWAGAPLGSPAAQLQKGQWQVGGELAFGESDWGAQGQCLETVFGVGSLAYPQVFHIEDARSTTAFAQFAYGLTGRWDVFARVGGDKAKTDFRVAGATVDSGNAGSTHMDSSYGIAAGLGTRATFHRRNAFSIGGVLQGTWFRPGGSRFSYPLAGPPPGTLVTNAKLRYFQLQAALAGLYQQEQWHAWLGPFLQHTEGNLDLDARYDFNGVPTGTITCAADLDSRTNVGLLLGAGVQARRCTYRVEGQFTSESWLLGVSGVVTVK